MYMNKTVYDALINNEVTVEEVQTEIKKYLEYVEETNKKMRYKALADAIKNYVGEDHSIWKKIDINDFVDGVISALEVVSEMPALVVPTEQKCSHVDTCSCDKEIVAKKPNVKKFTIEEANEIIDRWFKSNL